MMNKDKMIFIDMNGRFGNQLFQYAFARSLTIGKGFSITIDFNNVFRKGVEVNMPKEFVDYLGDLNVQPYRSLNNSGYLLKVYGSKKQKLMLRLYFFIRRLNNVFPRFHFLERYQCKMQKSGIYKEDECIIRFYNNYNSQVFIRGYFENPCYFDSIKELLRDEFTPKHPEKDKNEELYKIIRDNESVCVSFRTWKDIEQYKDLYNERNVCTRDYYDKAIDMMHTIHPNAVFVIFSDDVEFIKKNYSFKYRTFFEDGTDEVYEKFRLMYNCKHFIMSTSTFCWWAQYLSKNNNKTVISPSRWYNNNRKSKLLLDEWIKIPV